MINEFQFSREYDVIAIPPVSTQSTAEYLISERRERLGTLKEKIFDLLLIPLSRDSSERRVTLSREDWQTFTVGDAVGYKSGKLWHKELPDQPVEADE